MNFKSTIRINSLFWITSLSDSEVGVTRRVLEDLEPLCASHQFPFRHFTPATANDLLLALDEIAAYAGEGVLPIIHFDTHGSVESGIKIVQSGEWVNWGEIAGRLRKINKITGNNLCVVSGACFSYQLATEFDINLTSPFSILLAPEREILAGDVEQRTVGFYRALLNEEDLITAHMQWFPTQLRLFHCEKMFAILLAQFINNFGIGKQLDRHNEQIVTRTLDHHRLPRNRKFLRMTRSIVKSNSAPKELWIKIFIPTFFAGKKPGFTIAEIKRAVLDARAKGLKPGGPFAEPGSVSPPDQV